MLLAITITAMILAATYTAVQVSMLSYEETTDTSDLYQTARVVTERMRKEIRSAQEVSLSTNPAGLILTIPGDDGAMVVRYALVEGSLVYQTKGGEYGTEVVLLASTRDVTLEAFDVVLDQEVTQQGGQETTVTKNVTVRLKLYCDGRVLSVDASASPRQSVLE